MRKQLQLAKKTGARSSHIFLSCRSFACSKLVGAPRLSLKAMASNVQVEGCITKERAALLFCSPKEKQRGFTPSITFSGTLFQSPYLP